MDTWAKLCSCFTVVNVYLGQWIHWLDCPNLFAPDQCIPVPCLGCAHLFHLSVWVTWLLFYPESMNGHPSWTICLFILSRYISRLGCVSLFQPSQRILEWLSCVCLFYPDFAKSQWIPSRLDGVNSAFLMSIQTPVHVLLRRWTSQYTPLVLNNSGNQKDFFIFHFHIQHNTNYLIAYGYLTGHLHE